MSPHWIAPCHSMSTVGRLTAKMCVLGWIDKCFSTFGRPRLEALTGRGVCECALILLAELHVLRKHNKQEYPNFPNLQHYA